MSDYKTALSQSTIQSFIDEKRKFSFRSMDYINQAWADIQKDWGTTFLTGLIFYFLGIVAPFLVGGIYIGKYNERTRGEKYEMGTLFKGFDHGMPIFMYLLISMGIAMVVVMIPYILFAVFMALAQESAIFILLGFFMLFIMMIGAFLIGTLFFFSLHFIIFAGMDAWPAMKASTAIVRNNLGTVFIFILICGLLNMLGIMMCFVGVFVTMPLIYIAYYYAFNDVFQIEQKDATDEIIEHLI